MMPTAARKPYAALPVLWALVMLVLTLTPAKEMPHTPEWKFLSFDTAAHAGVFAVLAVLSWFSLSRQRRWPVLAQRAGTVVLVGCVLFGALIEVLQYVMNVGRHAEWTDLIGDSVGAALALLLVRGGSHWWHRRRLATSLVLLLLLGISYFFAPPARAQAPDMARVRRTIQKLASPQLHGRGYGRGGEHKAAAYLRGRLRQLGLQPLAPGFTQPFTLDVNTFPGTLKLAITGSQPHVLRPGFDFIAAPESGACSKAISTLLPLDTLLFTDTAAVRRLLQPAPLRGSLNGLQVTPAQLPTQRYLAGVVMRARDEARLATLPLAAQTLFSSLPLRVVLYPKLTASLASNQVAQVRLEVAAHSWPTTPQQAIALEIKAELKHDYPTQNIAAIVRGRTQPDSFLVVTAHYDHLGMMGQKAYFPGANDNASGVSLLLELAAYYARPENQPACSVVFLLFGAEEAGLLGSRYFVAHPLVPLPHIKFLVNLDLLGTGEEGATVVNGKVYEAAFQRLTALNNTHHYLPRLTARGRAANSDHFPFSEAGVPAFFIYTRGGSTAYHDVNDQPAALSLVGFSGAFGLIRDFLNGLGARPNL